MSQHPMGSDYASIAEIGVYDSSKMILKHGTNPRAMGGSLSSGFDGDVQNTCDMFVIL